MDSQGVLDIAKTTATQNGLDPDLIMAFCMIESNANTYALRYEDLYKYLLNPIDFALQLSISLQTETFCQKCSWGAMQIMGGVARERGFHDHLTKLVDPKISLDLSCKHFKKFLDKYKNIPDAVSAYNQGSARKNAQGKYINQSYVDKVMAKYKQLQAIK